MSENSFESLEKRAKYLRFKKRLKVIALPLLFCTALAAYYLYPFIENEGDLETKKSKQKEEKTKSKEVLVKKVESQAKPTDKNTTVKLEESVAKESEKVSKNENTSNANQVKSYDTIKLTLSIPSSFSSTATKQEKEIPEKKSKPAQQNTEIKKTFSMEVTSSDRQEVLLQNFNAKKDFKTAMELSRLFYEKSAYKKAIYWSKEASRLEPKSKIPWILYAKAKVRLNEKEDAIKALENYLNYFSSREIYDLLMQIKKEK